MRNTRPATTARAASRALLAMAAAALLAGCSLLAPLRSADNSLEGLTAMRVAANASAGPFGPPTLGRSVVLEDNDDAFEAKLDAVASAQSTIDIAYYLYADDYSSSAFSEALLTAARRGVRIRLLLDYHGNYARLDLFSMLEARSGGNLQVRLYNRPTPEIIADAAYLTLACDDAHASGKAGCAEAKSRAVAAGIARSGGANANVAGSGVFLSGQYGKNPGLMASAVLDGQKIDIDAVGNGLAGEGAASVEELKALAKIYWQANFGKGATRLYNELRLRYALLVYGDELRPLEAEVTNALPVDRNGRGEDAAREWNHVTDFLHHKLLLVDGRRLIIGGRNVEDANHMRANALSAKYTFMDTDVDMVLRGAPSSSLTASFERLWNFSQMVATLDEVRRHAPNDLLVATRAASASCNERPASRREACHATEVARVLGEPLAARHQAQAERMARRAATYRRSYQPTRPAQRAAALPFDRSAQVHYVENLPLKREAPAGRLFGARSGAEAVDAKHIHALWLSALRQACDNAREATDGSERRQVLLHNAYFFPSANLLSQLAQMVDGRQPCGGVDIVVLTNSIASTDLGIVNVFAAHSVKALLDHYALHHDPRNGASLRYYEYLGPTHERDGTPSLHSKVMLFDDVLYIGSANADVRSFMMDSNNGVLIGNAPSLVDAYRARLQAVLTDERRVRRVDAALAASDHETVLAGGDAFIDALSARYDVARHLRDPARIDTLKGYLRKLGAEAWRLSREIVAHHGASRDAQRRFDQLFKPI